MEILEIAIVGTILSGAIQIIKNTYGTSGATTKALTVGLAVAFGAAVYFLSGTELWTSILGVLGTASTVYAFLIKK